MLAQQMGLPMTLIAATNSNDALHQVLRSGVQPAAAAVAQTASPSMDIQVPYNVWRLLYVASGGDAPAVRAWQRDFGARALALPAAVRARLAERVRSAAIDDGATLRAMRDTHERCGYLLDPHTAVGVAAAQLVAAPSGSAGPVVCFGCAHPVKFLPTVRAAFGCTAEQALHMASGPAGAACSACAAS